MKAKLSLLLTLGMLALLVLPVQADVIPIFGILGVMEDESVTIQTKDFPANDTFYVRMGLKNTKGIDGILVTKITTGVGGSFKAKFYIPEELKGKDIIAIRLESPTSGYYSYNWFYNKTISAISVVFPPLATETPAPNSPTFHITAVSKGNFVDIKTQYFPPNETFAAFMKDNASESDDWCKVAGFGTGEGGSLGLTIIIPSELKDVPVIAIHFYSMDTGFTTYGSFENQDYP